MCAFEDAPFETTVTLFFSSRPVTTWSSSSDTDLTGTFRLMGPGTSAPLFCGYGV